MGGRIGLREGVGRGGGMVGWLIECGGGRGGKVRSTGGWALLLPWLGDGERLFKRSGEGW